MCRVGSVCRYFLAGSSTKPVTHHRSSGRVGPAARRKRSNCEGTDARFQSHYPMAIDTSRSAISAKSSHISNRDLRRAASFHVTGHTYCVNAERGETLCRNLPSDFSRERPHLSSFNIRFSGIYYLAWRDQPPLVSSTSLARTYLIALVKSHHLSTRRTIETFPSNGKYSLAAPMIILAADTKRICMTVKKCAEIGFIFTIAPSRRFSLLLLSTAG